ncbi:receptor expression-enhancing protein 3 [Drosophila albomicans]|uniref:Receptor expression-enhancing protein n=1 Tax=Drosophila albomicans TaxID=7291 RepID=A0A6P8X2J7_DROAB|nr:receptor expression-enhancing protein 3 [Drosophila albomicans]
MCFFSIVTRFLIITFGLLRPARYTHQAIDLARERELTAWSKYWVVYAGLVCIEMLGDAFFAWMPLYAETKLLIVLWLIVSAPQASVWVFDTILHPLLIRHASKIDHFLVHGKAHLLSDVLRYTSGFCVRSLNSVLPLVSQLWKKPPRHPQTDDALDALSNEEPDDVEPTIEESRTHSNQYLDAITEEESYDIAFPSSQSQSMGQINGAQRKNNFSKLSIPDLNKKLTTQLAALNRTKRKPYVYERQLDATTLKDDTEDSLQSQILAAERSLRAVHNGRERQRFP